MGTLTVAQGAHRRPLPPSISWGLGWSRRLGEAVAMRLSWPQGRSGGWTRCYPPLHGAGRPARRACLRPPSRASVRSCLLCMKLLHGMVGGLNISVACPLADDAIVCAHD
eukprot:1665328-Pleurochrysis_carterae.AAC.2